MFLLPFPIHENLNIFLEPRRLETSDYKLLHHFLEKIGNGLAQDYKMDFQALNWNEIYEMVWETYSEDYLTGSNLVPLQKTNIYSGVWNG